MKSVIEAAIDVGTNTMLLLVAEVETSTEPRKIKRYIDNQIRYVRLGEGMHRRVSGVHEQRQSFSVAAMQRARSCFVEFKQICDAHQVKKIYSIATSASRKSKNATEFYEEIFQNTGIKTQIIHGEVEAKLSFLGGLLPQQDPTQYAVMDIGGGSTEFVTLASDGKTLDGQSLEVGSVSASETFLKGDPYLKESLKELEDYLRKKWREIRAQLQDQLRKKKWVAVAGTPTTLAALASKLSKFESDALDGYRLDRCTGWDLYESLALQTEAQRKAHPLIGPGRSDILVAGTAILLTAMEIFEKDSFTVSTRGLRHGALLYPSKISS